MRDRSSPERLTQATHSWYRGIIATIVTTLACSEGPTVSSSSQIDASVAPDSTQNMSTRCHIIEIEDIHTNGNQVGESTQNTIRSGDMLTMNPRISPDCYSILVQQGDRLEDGGIVLRRPVTVSINTLDDHTNSIQSNVHLTTTGITPARIELINLADHRLIPAGFTGEAELSINGGPFSNIFSTRIWIDRNPPIFRASNPRLTSDNRRVTFTISASEATIFGVQVTIRGSSVPAIIPLPNRPSCTVLPTSRISLPQSCPEGQTCVLTNESISYCDINANAGRTQDGRPTDFTITLPQTLGVGESADLNFYATDLAGNRIDTKSTTNGDGGTMYKSIPSISISR